MSLYQISYPRIKGTVQLNLIPRLSSIRSSLEEETLVNAGHVAPRLWEPACQGWWLVLVKVCNCNLTFYEKCNKSYIYTNYVLMDIFVAPKIWEPRD